MEERLQLARRDSVLSGYEALRAHYLRTCTPNNREDGIVRSINPTFGIPSRGFLYNLFLPII
jgi:hypothetical protein